MGRAPKAKNCTLVVKPDAADTYATFPTTQQEITESNSFNVYNWLKDQMSVVISGHSPLLGYDPDSGLSKDRRRFIIISIFDATLTVLLWLICTVAKGDDWRKVFLQEIDILDPQFIHISLFDIVLCALLRMLVLIICYAVCVVKHWIPVAITTTISSVFLIVKVLFFFSQNQKQNGLPQYLLVLASFSLSWFELWLMPFKVLPRERRCEHHESMLSVNEPGSSASGRESGGSRRHTESRAPRPRAVERLTATRNHNPFSTDDEFRSAMEFSSDEELTPKRFNTPQIPAMLKEIYEKALHDAEIRVECLMREARQGEWKTLRANNPTVLQGPDQTYMIKASFRCSPLILFNAAWKDVMKWNPQVLQGKAILTLDATTELYHSISAPALKGYVSSRDFLDIRRIKLESYANVYQGVFVSVDSTLCPANASKKYVRGQNGASMIRASVGLEDGEAVMEWIMKTDLRGGLPKRLIQSSMLNYFVEHVNRLRDYIEKEATPQPEM